MAKDHRTAHAEYLERKIAAYLAEHGVPTCECGCGEPVKFRQDNGKPNRYIMGHHKHNNTAAVAAALGETIAVEDFRKALRKIKAQKGWTWEEMATAGGISKAHMHSILWHSRRQRVRVPWARDFLRRVAGLPAPITMHQERVLLRSAQRDAMIEREMDREINREIERKTRAS